MRRSTAFALAALILVTGCQQAAEPAPDYRPEEAGTVDHAMCLLGFTAIPLREASTGHHLVEATINGRSGSFVLDTGANATVIDEAHVGHFRLGGSLPSVGGAIGVGGGSRASEVPIERMRIGDVPIRRQRVVTSDLGQLVMALGRATGGTVYGIVGQDVLAEHRAIIDVARPMLYLMEADRDPAPVPSAECRERGAETAESNLQQPQ